MRRSGDEERGRRGGSRSAIIAASFGFDVDDVLASTLPAPEDPAPSAVLKADPSTAHGRARGLLTMSEAGAPVRRPL